MLYLTIQKYYEKAIKDMGLISKDKKEWKEENGIGRGFKIILIYPASEKFPNQNFSIIFLVNNNLLLLQLKILLIFMII